MDFSPHLSDSAESSEELFKVPRQGHDQKLIVADLTNFLDVLLILVIFFIVSTTITHPLLPLQLPINESTASNQTKYSKNTLHLSIAGDGVYRLQDTDYSYSELQRALTSFYAKNPDRFIIVYADQATPFGDFMKIVDLTKIIGFQELNIAGQPKAATGSNGKERKKSE